MPKLSLSVPHALGKLEAFQRLQKAAERIRADAQEKVKNIEEEWGADFVRFAFRTMGMNFKGTVTTADDAVQVDADLPFAAMMFKGKIEQGAREQLQRLLS